jgi:hypothetical protein
MNEDRLLHELARLERAEDETGRDRLDERWDRLAAGTLTAEEEAELRALAETSPEAREAYEAFRPLGAAFQARVVDALAAETRTPGSRVLLFRRNSIRLGAGLAAAAAVAAALLIFLRGPSSQPPMPVYTAELTGGTKAFRGEEGPSKGPQVFVPGSLLTITASPEQNVKPVEARSFFVRGRELVSLKPEVADVTGAVRLRGTLGTEIRLSPGDWRAWIVVGRPGGIPPMNELLKELRAGRTRHRSWQAVSQDLRVEGSPP